MTYRVERVWDVNGFDKDCVLYVDDPVLLYVEDDAEAAALFVAAMRQCETSFWLEVVKDLEGAFDYLSSKRPRPMAMLVDYTLGKFTGKDLIRWIRARQEMSEMEIAVFSGADDERQIVDCYRNGADFYLVKPTVFVDLVDVVRRIDSGFRRPAKKRVLYRLIVSPSYREPVINAEFWLRVRREEKL